MTASGPLREGNVSKADCTKKGARVSRRSWSVGLLEESNELRDDGSVDAVDREQCDMGFPEGGFALQFAAGLPRVCVNGLSCPRKVVAQLAVQFSEMLQFQRVVVAHVRHHFLRRLEGDFSGLGVQVVELFEPDPSRSRLSKSHYRLRQIRSGGTVSVRKIFDVALHNLIDRGKVSRGTVSVRKIFDGLVVGQDQWRLRISTVAATALLWLRRGRGRKKGKAAAEDRPAKVAFYLIGVWVVVLREVRGRRQGDRRQHGSISVLAGLPTNDDTVKRIALPVDRQASEFARVTPGLRGRAGGQPQYGDDAPRASFGASREWSSPSSRPPSAQKGSSGRKRWPPNPR